MNNSKMKIVITGGSGFLGVNLAQALLESDHEVCIISRKPAKIKGAWKYVSWDAHSPGEWVTELDGAGAIINLAGRSVDCIKTPDNCDVILRSRVETTQVIGQAIRQIKAPPLPGCKCQPLTFMATRRKPYAAKIHRLAMAWLRLLDKPGRMPIEKVLPTMRQVVFRTSFVLGRTGGALPRLAFNAKIGLGGKVGHGQQGISWLHEVDMNRLFIRAITDEAMKGVYIATAPNPVSNAEFMYQLRKAIGVPIGLPAMAWMVKIGAPWILKTDPELALYGRYCISKRLAEEGFEFKYPTVEVALHDIYRPHPNLTGLKV
jgi:uncharacterized protein (TIGR01777 family)